MIGLPKYLNTRDDYESTHKLAVAGSVPPEKMRLYWGGLLAGAYYYKFDKNLAEGDAADGPEPDYVVRDDQQPDGTTVRRQAKLTRDTNSRMDRFGYSEADVQAKIAELRG